MFKIIIITLLFELSKCFSWTEHQKIPQIFHMSLDEDNLMTLDWEIDYNNEELCFEIHLNSDFRWFAFGFSDRGELFPADYCLLWFSWKGKLQFQDVLADEKGMISLDHQQDCKNFKIKQRGNITKFMFQRQFDTCDPNDYIIEDGTTHIIWSKGKDSLYQVNGLNISTKSHVTNMVRVQLLKTILPDKPLPHHAKPLDILADNVAVPNEETTYWCQVHKLPKEFLDKHHVLQYEAIIQKSNEGLVHHMEVFHCIAPLNEDIPLYTGSCFASDRPKATQGCKRVLAAWAMGAKPFIYPEEAGLPIGGKNFNQFIMLEIHYNNPERKNGIKDSSGVRFYTTSKLKRMDAGVIELGLEYSDKMAIPPQQSIFSLTGYCVTECTAVSLPPDGITIFGSQLHTHLTGARVYTRHIRNGRELPEINRDDHYSTHFQEIRRLKRLITVLPGDALITTCDYNTENRENITLGGFAINDEMCVNYIHYFPATTLEVCKSSISDQGLTTYFKYMNEWENQQTSPGNAISSNYQAIQWNPIRVQLLEDVYTEAPLSMQCNMSSGDRFPGYWENTPITPILLPLPPKVRHCDN